MYDTLLLEKQFDELLLLRSKIEKCCLYLEIVGQATEKLMCDVFTIREIYLSAEPNSTPEDDAENFNTDVIVLVWEDEGEGRPRTVKYVASFFTYANITELRSRHIKTGEYLNGKYFYSKNMVLIDDCSIENIREVINQLVEEGEFGEVFRRI